MMHSFLTVGLLVALSTSAYGATCGSIQTTKKEIAGNTVTLTGPFSLSAGGAGNDGTASWVGKYARSGPPDGSCCNNFFVFGIPSSRVNTDASNFYLNPNGQLISIQNNIVYTAYENDPDDPLNAHVLLGTADDIGGNPTITCNLNGCALDCSVSGYSYNCLGSPGYQPDWRIAQAADGAGPGCAAFTPMVMPPSTVNEGNTDGPIASGAAVSSSSSAVASSSLASVSASSTAAKKKNKNDKTTTTVKGSPTTNGDGGFAPATPASPSVESDNFAVRTAAPIVVANAAIALGLLAAL